MTQGSRAQCEAGGLVFGSTSAHCGLFVPPPLASCAAGVPGFAVKRPISAYVKPFVASSVWMRMYCANARALLPLSIALLATETLGSLIEAGRPACFGSAFFAPGGMLGVPPIASCARLLWTGL